MKVVELGLKTLKTSDKLFASGLLTAIVALVIMAQSNKPDWLHMTATLVGLAGVGTNVAGAVMMKD
ncbi:MAG: hypothetical protein ACRC80_01160 [Waterburya sp.]